MTKIEKNTAQIDYLTVRLVSTNPMDVVKETLCLDASIFEPPCVGRYSYSNRIKAGNINVYYNDPCVIVQRRIEQMGVCVELSGQGCREYELLTGDPLALPKLMLANHVGAVTRIDLAFDDFSGKLDLAMMIAKTDNGEIRTKMRRHREIRGMGAEHGRTLYLGSQNSNSRIRIYDKAAERGIEIHWIRVEVVLRHADAMAFALAIRKRLGITGDDAIPMDANQEIYACGAGLILARAAFVEPTKKDRSLWPVSPWWRDFLDSAQTVELAKDRPVPTIERAKKWIYDSVAPTFVILLMLLGPKWLIDVITQGLTTINGKQYDKYQRFRASYIMTGNNPDCDLANGAYSTILEHLLYEVIDAINTLEESPASKPAKTKNAGDR